MEKQVRSIWVSTIKGAAANGVTGTSSLRTSATDHTWKSAIAKGDIYLANSNYSILGTSNVTNEIFIAQGLGAGSLKVSEAIDVQGITNVKKEAYQAKQNLVKAVGYSSASTGNDLPRTFAKSYKLRIEIRTDFRTQYSRTFVVGSGAVFTYNVSSSVTGASLDTANAAFYQQFVDAINNDKVASKYVTAALVNDAAGSGATKYGITITGKSQTFKLQTPPQIVSFDIFFQNTTDITDAATVTEVTPLRTGTGTYERVANAEWEIQGYRGQSNFTLFPANTPIVYADPNGTYVTYSIEGFNTRASDLGKQVKLPFVHVIAIDSTNSTLITAFETMLAAITTTTGAPYTDNAETITPSSGNAV